jgi:hypothetical protein
MFSANNLNSTKYYVVLLPACPTHSDVSNIPLMIQTKNMTIMKVRMTDIANKLFVCHIERLRNLESLLEVSDLYRSPIGIQGIFAGPRAIEVVLCDGYIRRFEV